MAEHDNRRDFSRVKTHIDVELECGDRVVGGRLTDVSMQGVGLACDEKLALQAECLVRLYLGDPRENSLCIMAKGKVVRSTEGGIGVEFTEIDLDSYDHLRNLVLHNANDVARIEGELKDHLGLKKPIGL
jgi:hypothetical protein